MADRKLKIWLMVAALVLIMDFAINALSSDSDSAVDADHGSVDTAGKGCQYVKSYWGDKQCADCCFEVTGHRASEFIRGACECRGGPPPALPEVPTTVAPQKVLASISDAEPASPRKERSSVRTKLKRLNPLRHVRRMKQQEGQ